MTPKFVVYRTKIREGFSQNPTFLLLPELTEEHRILRITYSSVHKGPGSGCIAPDYRGRKTDFQRRPRPSLTRKH